MTPDEAYRYATGRCARAELCRADLRPKLLARGLAPADADALLDRLTGGHVDFTIGSALDLFGGKIPYEKMRMFCD